MGDAANPGPTNDEQRDRALRALQQMGLTEGGTRRRVRARRAALQTQVAPVLFDMLLLAARTGRFWPTPGSTMSQTVCFWRAAWGLDGAASITSCEDFCVAP